MAAFSSGFFIRARACISQANEGEASTILCTRLVLGLKRAIAKSSPFTFTDPWNYIMIADGKACVEKKNVLPNASPRAFLLHPSLCGR